jgi:hypothetical protein
VPDVPTTPGHGPIASFHPAPSLSHSRSSAVVDAQSGTIAVTSWRDEISASTDDASLATTGDGGGGGGADVVDEQEQPATTAIAISRRAAAPTSRACARSA